MTSRYEELFLPGQREEIVKKIVGALKSGRQLSNKTINRFRNILKDGKPIPGFNKDPIRALPHMLEQNILERMENVPLFEYIVAELWAETESELRDAVSEQLDGIDSQVFLSDDEDEDFWNAQVKLLTDKQEEYEEDDILLMTKVCYAHAKSEAGVNPDEEATAQAQPREPSSVEETLDFVLESLRKLPVAFPLWRESVPQFMESLNNIIDEKNRELLQIKEIMENLDRIQSEFSAELLFFRHGAEEWDTLTLATLLTDANGIDESARTLMELESAFQTYRTITGRADTLVEERERREKRHELEVTIEGMLSEIDELPQTIAAEPDSDSAGHAQSEADPQLREELDALKREHEALLDSNHALKQEAEALDEANRALQGEVAGLNADKQALAGEVAELRSQLQISERQELYWRNVYEAEMSSKDSSAPGPIPSEIQSVRQAVALARTRYDDKLAFRLNKKSDPDYDYTRPKEVWDALEWLATTYYDSQMGGIRVTNLNESIRSACSGWEYKSDQNDITFNMYREWYTTSKDGVSYELRKHLSKGTGRDRNVIRIGFEWDEETNTVLIGYIGPHQRSRAS